MSDYMDAKSKTEKCRIADEEERIFGEWLEQRYDNVQHNPKGSYLNRMGVDYLVFLEDGRVFSIDFKAKNGDSFCFEKQSEWGYKGWIYMQERVATDGWTHYIVTKHGNEYIFTPVDRIRRYVEDNNLPTRPMRLKGEYEALLPNGNQSQIGFFSYETLKGMSKTYKI